VSDLIESRLTTANPVDPSRVVEAIRSVVGEHAGLHEPEFAGNEWNYVRDTIDTGWVSSAGSYVDRFEEMLAERIGVARVVATANGTAALHLALLMAGVAPGDEVLIPALTFVATANAVVYCGAVPHFVDVSEQTLGIDPQRLALYLDRIGERVDGQLVNRNTGRPMRAVLPMHTFGHPVDLDPLIDVCDRFGIALVEDAAESIGSYYKGRHTGGIGRIGALSFNGNKTVTTGGGGAVITNDGPLGARAKHLSTQAKVPHRWEYIHDAVGFNYRLPNLNAALGCAQLEQLDGFLRDKRRLAERYAEAFASIPGVRFFVEPPFARSNYWLNAILLDEPVLAQRDAVLSATNEAGLMTRPVWRLMHRLPMYADAPRDSLAVSEALEARLVSIPSSARFGR
jgi:perosamine synthetase